MGFVKKKAQKPKNRQTKTSLVWDDESRKDYLTGFRKRKAERKKYYQDKLKRKMLEERKELKKQAREVNKKRMQMDLGRYMPEVEQIVDATEFDLPNHTVTITDITDIDFSSEGGLRLGQNLVKSDEESDGETKKPTFNKADEKRLVKLKKKLQKCGNEKKRRPKAGKHNAKGGKSKEKKKFKKRNKH